MIHILAKFDPNCVGWGVLSSASSGPCAAERAHPLRRWLPGLVAKPFHPNPFIQNDKVIPYEKQMIGSWVIDRNGGKAGKEERG